jgi:hypothetical protein
MLSCDLLLCAAILAALRELNDTDGAAGSAVAELVRIDAELTPAELYDA